MRYCTKGLPVEFGCRDKKNERTFDKIYKINMIRN